MMLHRVLQKVFIVQNRFCRASIPASSRASRMQLPTQVLVLMPEAASAFFHLLCHVVEGRIQAVRLNFNFSR